jgi:type III pantothenate kinase
LNKQSLTKFYLKLGNSRGAWICGRNRGEFSRQELQVRLLQLLRRYQKHPWVIASVLKSEEDFLKKQIKKNNMMAQWIKPKDLSVPLAYTKGIGIDRALNCFWLSRSKLLPALVIDLGSAITVDFMDHQAKHRGGWILAGPRLQLEALYEKTDQLPQLRWRQTQQLWGKSTHDCIQSGLAHQIQALIDGARQRAEAQVGRRVNLVLTGGWARRFRVRGAKYKEDLSLHAMKLLS